MDSDLRQVSSKKLKYVQGMISSLIVGLFVMVIFRDDLSHPAGGLWGDFLWPFDIILFIILIFFPIAFILSRSILDQWITNRWLTQSPARVRGWWLGVVLSAILVASLPFYINCFTGPHWSQMWFCSRA